MICSKRTFAPGAGAVGGAAVADQAIAAAAPREVAPVAANALRILMVVESSAGGTGRHVLDLAEGLRDRRCEVHVICSSRRVDRFFLDRAAGMDGVRVTQLPLRTSIHPADVSAVRAIRRYLRQNGPFDVIHGHSSKGGALARLAALGTGVPAFYTLHGLIMMDPGLARWKRLFYLAIELALSLRTSGIIAVAPEEMRAAVRLGLGRRRVLTIPNGVDRIPFRPRALARAELGATDDQLLIGFVGRFVEQKAPHVLIEAFARAAEVLPQARLVMVGDGPLREPSKALSSRLGVQEKIHWLGERDAREILTGLDLFALSSRKEGLPYVVLEAMAAGLPVVATRSSGVEILVEPGVNGSVVPTDDVAAFARALIDCGQNADRRRAMGQASLTRVKRFSIDAMIDQTMRAYLERRQA